MVFSQNIVGIFGIIPNWKMNETRNLALAKYANSGDFSTSTWRKKFWTRIFSLEHHEDNKDTVVTPPFAEPWCSKIFIDSKISCITSAWQISADCLYVAVFPPLSKIHKLIVLVRFSDCWDRRRSQLTLTNKKAPTTPHEPEMNNWLAFGFCWSTARLWWGGWLVWPFKLTSSWKTNPSQSSSHSDGFLFWGLFLIV